MYHVYGTCMFSYSACMYWSCCKCTYYSCHSTCINSSCSTCAPYRSSTLLRLTVANGLQLFYKHAPWLQYMHYGYSTCMYHNDRTCMYCNYSTCAYYGYRTAHSDVRSLCRSYRPTAWKGVEPVFSGADFFFFVRGVFNRRLSGVALLFCCWEARCSVSSCTRDVRRLNCF